MKKEPLHLKKILPICAAAVIISAVMGTCYCLCGIVGDTESSGTEGLNYLAREDERDVRSAIDGVNEAQLDYEASLGSEETGKTADDDGLDLTEEELKQNGDDIDTESTGDMSASKEDDSVSLDTEDDNSHENDVKVSNLLSLKESLLAEVEGTIEYHWMDETEVTACKDAFGRAALIGDSMAQAAFEYDYLRESQVFYIRGASVDEMTPVLEPLSQYYPEKAVFFKGLNDCNHFATTDEFLECYIALIEEVRAENELAPEEIYVCSLLPGNAAIQAERDDLRRSDIFDEALQVMCTNIGYHYVDTKWLVREDWYLEDGIHMNAAFYNLWVQYLTAYIKD